MYWRTATNTAIPEPEVHYRPSLHACPPPIPITYHLDTVLNGILPPTTRSYQMNIFREMSTLKLSIAYLVSTHPSHIYPLVISVP